jgi:signal transduction histidine kinase
VDLSDTIPQSNKDGYGIPKWLLVEGANRPDFSDAVRLLEFRAKTVYDVGPIIMRRFRETPCRYVRLIAIEPDTEIRIRDDTRRSRIGFAEIEFFSQGQNVAFGMPVSANFPADHPRRLLSAMTDGRNFYGKILPIRDWLNDLARRHDLEAERPLVITELRRRYARQKVHLTWVTWLAVLLAVGIGFTILIDRMVRMRQVAKIRNRFAADLHDELGANLHVIGLLGDLAQAAVDSPEKLKSIHQRIRIMTERSGTAVQYCTNMLEAKGLYEDLHEDMQRFTERIMADLDGELSFQGKEEILRGLKPGTRADLFLFYKECLVNISRHSEATHFSARLTATPKEVCLTVRDNGHGLADSPVNGVSASLRRRARLLGAQVTAQHPDSGGTCITLKLRTRKWGRRK